MKSHDAYFLNMPHILFRKKESESGESADGRSVKGYEKGI